MNAPAMTWSALSRPVALVVVLAIPQIVGCGREPRPTLGPAPASPVTSVAPRPSIDEVKDAIRRGQSSLRSFRADVVLSRARVAGETRATLEWTARGTIKESKSEPRNERVILYSAELGSRVRYNKPASDLGAPTVLIETGVPPESQAQLVPGDAATLANPVGSARSVLAWADVAVSRSPVEGRAAWIVQRSSPGEEFDFQAITIDEQSGLALRVQALNGGQPEYDMRVENLVTNVEGEPSFAVPPGTTTRSGDEGFTRMTLQQARRSAPYDPLLPGWLPAGFTQAEVAYFSPPPGATGRVGPGPGVRPDTPRVVSVAFRRGLELFVVSTSLRSTFSERPTGSTFPPGETPVGEEGPRRLPKFEKVPLSQGPFVGRLAERWLAPDGRASLSATNDELDVRISGDVTLDEIVRIAESLQPAR